MQGVIGLFHRRPLAREIAVALAVKAAALALLYVAFFAPRPEVTPAVLENALLEPAARHGDAAND